MDIKKDVAVSDSGFVFYPTTGESFTVNPLGMEIIRLTKEGQSSGEIIKYIEAHYHVEPSMVEKDLNDFYEMLNHFSLLEEDEEA